MGGRLFMIIFKSHSTHPPTREKVTTSNHYNLTGNLCEKRVTQPSLEPKTFGLPCQRSTPELLVSDHTTAHGTTCTLLYPLGI